jgi:hypothetical protein
MNAAVRALAVSATGELFAGGDFTTAGGVSASRVARWDGANWSPLGSGVNNAVYALGVNDSGEVYAGGFFNNAGGSSALFIAKWDGSNWTPLGSGLNGAVHAIAVEGSDVYAAGVFTTAGGSPAARIAHWDGAAWHALGSGLGDLVEALALVSESLVVGGRIQFIGGGKISAYIAQWMPRVDAGRLLLAASPGDATLGDDVHGFHKPCLTTFAGTTVNYAGGLPVEVSIERAPEIHLAGHRINGAFSLAPTGVAFSGSGATLRVEFSEDDVAAYVPAYASDYTDFRAVKLTYPWDYPTNKEAVGIVALSESPAIPIRIENGKQIYAITVPFDHIGSTYGAVPESLALSTGIEPGTWEVYR